MTLRILITGSRDWTNKHAIAQALLKAIGDYGPHLIVDDPQLYTRVLWDQITVIHGGARGADRLAGHVAQNWRMNVDVVPADWDRHGRAAGHIRNQAMVDAGAHVCLAFPLGESRGTRDCMRRAHAAGIPVVEVAA